MLIVELEEAKAGMTLAAPVAHPGNPQHDLLKRGYTLEEGILPRLQDLGITSLYVDYPGLADLDRHLAPQLSPTRQVMYRQIRDTMNQVQGRTSPGVSFPSYYETTREMVTTLLSQGPHPIYMEQLSGIGTDAVAHATTVAHLSLLIGLRLETYLVQQRARLAPQHAREVVNLGVAGMLHDVGKLKIAEELRDFCEIDPPVSDECNDAREQWEAHSRIGYEMLRGGIESSAAAAVLHHHQHFDGTGFPRPAAKRTVPGSLAPLPAPTAEGEHIHVFARIMYAADVYANLARPTAGDTRRGNLEVLHLMRSKYAQWIDPKVLAALMAVAPPFLPGSKVVLDDGTTAAVVGVPANEPYQPLLRRFKADTGELDDVSLDLRVADAPRILTLSDGTPVSPYLPEGPENALSAVA